MQYRKTEMIRNRIVAVAAAFVLTPLAGGAALGHTDVEMELDGSTLSVPPVDHGDGHLLFVYEGDLDTTVLPRFVETIEPGFAGEDGTFVNGQTFSFMALSDVIYTDGAGSTPGAAPTGHAMFIGNTLDLLTNGGSYDIGTADIDGGIHEDPLKTLDSGSDGVAPTPGIYAFLAKLTSPSYDDSNTFMIALNLGVAEEDFEEGLDLLAETYGLEVEAEAVPTPSAAAMMLVSGVLAAMRRRRRK